VFPGLLKTRVVGLPIPDSDNNQHGAKQNFGLQNLWREIDVFAGILAGPQGK
jgi:hypothetical protein